MNRIALLALSALLATPAVAQERSCRDVRALINADGEGFRAVSFSMQAGTGLFITVRNRRIDLPAAHDCDMNVDRDGESGLGCNWEAATPAEAGAVYDRLVARINPCLARPMEPGSPFAGTGLRIVQSHSRDIVAAGRSTGLSLTLFEHAATGAEAPGGARPAYYVIALWLALETGQVAEPEGEEEDDDAS